MPSTTRRRGSLPSAPGGTGVRAGRLLAVVLMVAGSGLVGLAVGGLVRLVFGG